MDIMSFRMAKENLLEKLSNEHRALANAKIEATLSLLRQETMSIESMAVIIICTQPKGH